MSPAVGVYPVADALTAGDEISSTYEGRHITVREDELKHPVNAGGFVDKGDPVIICQAASEANFGAAVGVAFNDGAAAADLIAVDTEGIWVLDVDAEDDNGAGSAVVPGDRLYINTTTCIISKINNSATQLPFGYALGRITANLTETIAVKVHWDPSLDTADQMFKTVASGRYNYGKQWVGLLEAGLSTGVAGYFAAQIDGQQTGNIYGLGTWVEPQATFIANGSVSTPLDLGYYCANGAGQDMSLAWLVGINMAMDIGENPARIDWLRVNSAATTGAINSVIAAANPNSVGYIAAITEADAPIGYIPMFDIVGLGVVYVRIYADTD